MFEYLLPKNIEYIIIWESKLIEMRYWLLLKIIVQLLLKIYKADCEIWRYNIKEYRLWSISNTRKYRKYWVGN